MSLPVFLKADAAESSLCGYRALFLPFLEGSTCRSRGATIHKPLRRFQSISDRFVGRWETFGRVLIALIQRTNGVGDENLRIITSRGRWSRNSTNGNSLRTVVKRLFHPLIVSLRGPISERGYAYCSDSGDLRDILQIRIGVFKVRAQIISMGCLVMTRLIIKD